MTNKSHAKNVYCWKDNPHVPVRKKKFPVRKKNVNSDAQDGELWPGCEMTFFVGALLFSHCCVWHFVKTPRLFLQVLRCRDQRRAHSHKQLPVDRIPKLLSLLQAQVQPGSEMLEPTTTRRRPHFVQVSHLLHPFSACSSNRWLLHCTW